MTAFATLAPVHCMPPDTSGEANLSRSNPHTARLGSFLASVELKAFKLAQVALRHEDDALDAVQEAMMQLASRYGDRREDEWRPLFYRILQNKVRDLQRRRRVRNRVMAWLPFRRDDEDEDAEADPIARTASTNPVPDEQLQLEESVQALERALRDLPLRQQQAFMLRNLEGLDVEQTAIAMSCSQGSVKTHYFRALHALREKLRNFHEHS